MKTYTILLPENPSPALEAVVDTTLRAFELAVKSCSAYKWGAIRASGRNDARWVDTDCENAISALKLELSNIGVRVEAQKPMDYISAEAWDIAAERAWK